MKNKTGTSQTVELEFLIVRQEEYKPKDFPPSGLTDLELRIAIAMEVCFWNKVAFFKDGSSHCTVPGVMSTIPLAVPNWPSSHKDVDHLIDTMRRYSKALYLDVAGLTARKKAENVLAAYRALEPTQKLLYKRNVLK